MFISAHLFVRKEQNEKNCDLLSHSLIFTKISLLYRPMRCMEEMAIATPPFHHMVIECDGVITIRYAHTPTNGIVKISA